MSASLVPAPTTNPLRRIAFDIGTERAARSSGIPFPPGPMSFSLVRTRRFSQSPLPILLDCYERYGPVFSIRILHSPVVFMLGPEDCEHALADPQHVRPDRDARHAHERDVAVGDEHVVELPQRILQLLLPAPLVRLLDLHLGEHPVVDELHELVLVRHVRVQGCGASLEAIGHATHAQALQALLIHDREGDVHDRVAVERSALARV